MTECVCLPVASDLLGNWGRRVGPLQAHSGGILFCWLGHTLAIVLLKPIVAGAEAAKHLDRSVV